MPNLSAYEMSTLRAVIAELCPAMALALAEQLNSELTLEVDTVVSIKVQDAQKRSESVLYTVFALSPPFGPDSVFLIPHETACLCFDLLEGKKGLNPPGSLSEDDVSKLHHAIHGMISGLATALTNRFGDHVELEACNSHLSALSLPPAFALNDSAAQVSLTLTIPGIHDGTATFLFPPEWVQSLAPPVTLDTGPETDPSIMQEDELAAMLNDIGGFGASPSETSKLSAGPGSSAAPFSSFPSAPQEHHMPRGMELIMDIPLDGTVELGRVRMLIKDVLELSSGSIVELDRVAGEPVDLLVNGRLVAKGEVVVIEENFGIRLTEIVSPADRVSGLGRGR